VTYACTCEVDEPFDHIAETRPRARRHYTCTECDGPIAPGDAYLRHVGFSRWQEQPETYRICLACEEPFEWVRRNCGCWLYGDLFRHLREDVMDGLRGALPPGVATRVGRWVVLARRRGWRLA
jgi:hypothetical protein